MVGRPPGPTLFPSTALLRAASAPTAYVAVARSDISISEPLNPLLVGTKPWPADMVPNGAFDSMEPLVGRVPNQHFAAGEPILESGLFAEGGFKSRVLSDIRSEIWLKLWGNLTFNPISALTHSTLADICQFPLTRELAGTMMGEAQAVGEKLGARFRVSMEKRIAGAEGVGKHKTSMLQDLEAGKPMEIQGMLGAVIELAEMTNTEVPTLRALYACVSLLDRTVREIGRSSVT